MGTYVPPEWPAGVHPPGSEDFESTAVGWLLFGELLSGWQAAGAALVLGGVVLAQRASERQT